MSGISALILITLILSAYLLIFTRNTSIELTLWFTLLTLDLFFALLDLSFSL